MLESRIESSRKRSDELVQGRDVRSRLSQRRRSKQADQSRTALFQSLALQQRVAAWVREPGPCDEPAEVVVTLPIRAEQNQL